MINDDVNRANFEELMTTVMAYHPDDLIWQESRNCYADFSIHLAYQAWLESPKSVAPMLVTDWQPIETAPKDGSTVDIWRKAFGGHRVTNMRYVCISGNNWFFEPVADGPTCVRDATHWMPLPAAPKAV